MYPCEVSAKSDLLRRDLDGFGGLERTDGAPAGALADSRGLSFARFPKLATGGGWVTDGGQGEVTDLFGWDKLCAVEGTTFTYGGEAVGTVLPGRKQYAVVGTKLCIFPDRKYLDLTTKEFGDLWARVDNRVGLEAVFTANSLTLEADTHMGSASFRSRNVRPHMNRTEHRSESGIYHYFKSYGYVGWDEETGWTKVDEQELWLIDSAVEHQVGRYVILAQPSYAGAETMNLKQIRETRSADGQSTTDTFEVLYDYAPDSQSGLYGIITGVSVERRDELYYGQAIVKDVTFTLELHNAGAGNRGFDGRFFPGDRVFVHSCAKPENNTPWDRPLTVESVGGHTMTFVVPKGQEGVFTPFVDTGDLAVERVVPQLDFVCESDNRLFGVSNAEGRIYASAQGDPRNFYALDGGAGDSWSQSVGTAGDFTGCVAYSGSVLFWKEDCLHKLMGARPSSYALYTYYVDGLQAGSEGSMAIVNDVLYYKGRLGLYAYTGSTPKRISAALGAVGYGSAVGVGDGEVYRVSMERSDGGGWENLSYHTGHKRWLKEGEAPICAFARVGATVHGLLNGRVYTPAQGEGIPWEADFVPFTEGTPQQKRLFRLLLGVELGEGAWLEVDLATDDGPFQTVWTGREAGRTVAVIPLRPCRCRDYRLRLRGEGSCVITGLRREFSLGGEG